MKLSGIVGAFPSGWRVFLLSQRWFRDRFCQTGDLVLFEPSYDQDVGPIGDPLRFRCLDGLVTLPFRPSVWRTRWLYVRADLEAAGRCFVEEPVCDATLPSLIYWVRTIVSRAVARVWSNHAHRLGFTFLSPSTPILSPQGVRLQ